MTMTGSRPAAALHTASVMSRRSSAVIAVPSPVEPQMYSPPAPSATCMSTSGATEDVESVADSSKGVNSAGMMHCS